tara:strand:+ start:907 stop:1050 length:144 start_codon:yes stop_codon:yes gene_type:complete
MSPWINGLSVGSLKPYGIDHALKQNTAFAKSGTADIDDLPIWSLRTD